MSSYAQMNIAQLKTVLRARSVVFDDERNLNYSLVICLVWIITFTLLLKIKVPRYYINLILVLYYNIRASQYSCKL